MTVDQRLRRLWSEHFGPPPDRTRVASDFIKTKLEEIKSPAVLDQLFEFGQLMLDEVSSRTVILESKATSIAGWTTGLLALFIIQPPKPVVALSRSELVLTTLGVIGAMGALVATARVLRVRSWNWPSQSDWFHASLFQYPNVLRGFHLLAMLETHEAHCGVNADKARWLKLAQFGFLIAGFSLGLQLAVALFLNWWTPIGTP